MTPDFGAADAQANYLSSLGRCDECLKSATVAILIAAAEFRLDRELS
jgi:hypothetical protein